MHLRTCFSATSAGASEIVQVSKLKRCGRFSGSARGWGVVRDPLNNAVVEDEERSFVCRPAEGVVMATVDSDECSQGGELVRGGGLVRVGVSGWWWRINGVQEELRGYCAQKFVEVAERGLYQVVWKKELAEGDRGKTAEAL